MENPSMYCQPKWFHCSCVQPSGRPVGGSGAILVDLLERLVEALVEALVEVSVQALELVSVVEQVEPSTQEHLLFHLLSNHFCLVCFELIITILHLSIHDKHPQERRERRNCDKVHEDGKLTITRLLCKRITITNCVLS